jgi:hypothetical protein
MSAGGLTVDGGLDRVAVPPQVTGHDLANPRLVVDEEDALTGAGCGLHHPEMLRLFPQEGQGMDGGFGKFQIRGYFEIRNKP